MAFAGSVAIVAPRTTERLLNLTIALLSAPHPLTKQRLRSVVIGYENLSDQAFNRQFERDKDELRAAGVPIEVDTQDLSLDGEQGYRIRRAAFELPAVRFDDEELSALGLAAGAWQQASVAGQAVAAITTLRAAGVEPDTERIEALAPHINADEPAFDVCWQATLQHREISFGYRHAGVRRVQPWSVRWRRGSWYLLGRDLDRDAPRVFKLGRMDEVPRVVGPANGYPAPSETELAACARGLEPGRPDACALIAVRGAKLPRIRRSGEEVACERHLPEGFRCYRVPFSSSMGFAAEIAAAGPDALVLEPLQLREQVIAQLEAVRSSGAGATGSGS
ncbi:proteasome accessory factor B [Propionibacterium cyclohexanicum]|uniref:Proteasome accessory factor B n=1 Tax=Propionibacterium cyclohexanicum TaxID=64702 RepID=A0A1H9QTF5_9ACTN|nr:proteasome accessory factor B [Propionibacterium cyclohexanicum]